MSEKDRKPVPKRRHRNGKRGTGIQPEEEDRFLEELSKGATEESAAASVDRSADAFYRRRRRCPGFRSRWAEIPDVRLLRERELFRQLTNNPSLAAAAVNAGLSIRYVSRRMDTDPVFDDSVDAARGSLAGEMVDKLVEKARAGDLKSVLAVLRILGMQV